jgi:ferredoxin
MHDMRAKVDENLCAGASECEDTCPQVFKVIDGMSKVQVETVPTEAEEACREAAGNCPMGAISIEE